MGLLVICSGKGQAIQTKPQFSPHTTVGTLILNGTWITDIHAPRMFAAMSPTSAHIYYMYIEFKPLITNVLVYLFIHLHN